MHSTSRSFAPLNTMRDISELSEQEWSYIVSFLTPDDVRKFRTMQAAQDLARDFNNPTAPENIQQPVFSNTAQSNPPFVTSNSTMRAEDTIHDSGDHKQDQPQLRNKGHQPIADPFSEADFGHHQASALFMDYHEAATHTTPALMTDPQPASAPLFGQEEDFEAHGQDLTTSFPGPYDWNRSNLNLMAPYDLDGPSHMATPKDCVEVSARYTPTLYTMNGGDRSEFQQPYNSAPSSEINSSSLAVDANLRSNDPRAMDLSLATLASPALNRSGAFASAAREYQASTTRLPGLIFAPHADAEGHPIAPKVSKSTEETHTTAIDSSAAQRDSCLSANAPAHDTTTATATFEIPTTHQRTRFTKSLNRNSALKAKHADLTPQQIFESVGPDDISGALLLRLAETMSNKEITQCVNDLLLKQDKSPISSGNLIKRIRFALEAKHGVGDEYYAKRKEFNELRKANGIRVREDVCDKEQMEAVAFKRTETVEANRDGKAKKLGETLHNAKAGPTAIIAGASYSTKPNKRTATVANLDDGDSILQSTSTPPVKRRGRTTRARPSNFSIV